MASETVDLIDWSHPTPPRAVPRPPTVRAWVYYAVRLINSFIFFSNNNISSVFQYRGYTFYEWIIHKNKPHVCKIPCRPRPGAIEGLGSTPWALRELYKSVQLSHSRDLILQPCNIQHARQPNCLCGHSGYKIVYRNRVKSGHLA